MNAAVAAQATSSQPSGSLKLGVAFAGGFDDWHIPSRDELEVCYRAFKPTKDENYCWRGDNPSSEPVGYAYSLDSPAQTQDPTFQEGGAEAFSDVWYWTSTQYAGNEGSAWVQYFGSGTQTLAHKSSHYRVRAVRRVPI